MKGPYWEKEYNHTTGDLGSIPGPARYPGEGNGYPHSNILAWRILWAEEPGGLQTDHGVTKSHTRLSNTHTHTQQSQGAQCKRPSHLAGLGCWEVATSVGQRLWVCVKLHRLEWVPPGVCTGQGRLHLVDGEEGQRPGPFPSLLTWCRPSESTSQIHPNCSQSQPLGLQNAFVASSCPSRPDPAGQG